MAFKELYSFTIEEEKEVEKTSKRKNNTYWKNYLHLRQR